MEARQTDTKPMRQFVLHAQPYLPGRVKGPVRIGKAHARRDAIVVLDQAALTDFDGPCSALAVIDGLPFSHALIRVQGTAIPTVIVTAEQAAQLPADRELVLDGQRGMIFDPQQLAQYPALRIQSPALFTPPRTRDGEPVLLRASVSDRNGVRRSLSSGASAIGLLRMEYLGVNSRRPPEADFFANELGTCCSEAEPLPLIARLPDFDAVKQPEWFKALPLSIKAAEHRGAARYRQEPFQTLLKDICAAVNRCSEFYDLRLMLPYIDSEAAFVELRDRILPQLSDLVAIGAMLETVQAVQKVSAFLDLADFVAIGTNDLLADLFHCDRERDAIDPYHPAIYQLLQQVAEQAGNQTREIQLNGQLARMPGVLPVLIGLGYRIFSVDPLLIPYLGETVQKTHTDAAAALAAQVCGMSSAQEIQQRLLN
mgnify:CR=1 FL=1